MSCNCQSDKFDLSLVRITTRADVVFNIGDLDDDHPHSQNIRQESDSSQVPRQATGWNKEHGKPRPNTGGCAPI